MGRFFCAKSSTSATAPRAREAIREPDSDVLIDCAGLTFIDLRGLRPLLSAHRRCTKPEATGWSSSRILAASRGSCELTNLEAVFQVQTGE